MALELVVEGVNTLDVSDLKKLFAAQGVALETISTASEHSVGSNSLGDPGSGQLLIDVAKIGQNYLPIVLGIEDREVVRGHIDHLLTTHLPMPGVATRGEDTVVALV